MLFIKGENYCNYLTAHPCVDDQPCWWCYCAITLQFKTFSALFYVLLGHFGIRPVKTSWLFSSNCASNSCSIFSLFSQNRVVSCDRWCSTALDKFIIGTFALWRLSTAITFVFLDSSLWLKTSITTGLRICGPGLKKCHSNFLIYCTSPETAEVIETWFYRSCQRPVTAEQLQF